MAVGRKRNSLQMKGNKGYTAHRFRFGSIFTIGYKMSIKQVFVLQNQDNYFLSKESLWVDGRDTKELFKTPHRDIAVNQLFEINSQDYQQRIHIVECEAEARGTPIIDPDILPPPLPKVESEPADVEGEENSTEMAEKSDEPQAELLVQ